jgi:hypothetical protein
LLFAVFLVACGGGLTPREPGRGGEHDGSAGDGDGSPSRDGGPAGDGDTGGDGDSLPHDASAGGQGDAGPEQWPDASLVTEPARPGSEFADWGNETLDAIERDFRKAGSDLYVEALGKDAISFNWPAGVQLHALIAAGRIAQAETYANAMHDAYWCNTRERWGYNAGAYGCGDRYYDDNAWVAKALMELHEHTHDDAYLARAKEVLAFSMSGENPVDVMPFGGIRWHEGDADGQCLCATAPTLVANLMIHRATGEQQYLTDGLRLYNWVKANRYGYGPGYRGYENAVITQGAVLLFQITHDYSYLEDAHHIAYAMESNYVDWQTHALRETGQWGGHDMTNAYVDLFNADGDVTWLNIVAGYLGFLHANSKDGSGRYPETWTETGVDGKPELIYQASAARAFARMGNTPGGGNKFRDPVAVFRDCNYTGFWQAGFLIGRYARSDLEFHGIEGKGISSLRVQPGYRVTLYDGENFDGASVVKTADDGCLSDWNDRANSMVVEAVAPTAVVYKDCNFTGSAHDLPVGRYDANKLRALGLSPKTISSLQVSEGYEVTLHDGERFDGEQLSTGSDGCLVTAGWNDRAVSVVVRKK